MTRSRIAPTAYFGLFALVAACASEPTPISLDAIAFNARLEESRADARLSLIDVRTPAEYAEGHLEGAELIDFYSPDFRSRIDALPRDGIYLLYCRSGNRSGQAVALMLELGFENVAHLSGGIGAWLRAGYPVAR
jgi:rhodanese-related sulfurtransferase